jgi:plastocyanin
MRRVLTAASLAALVLGVYACSNYGSSPSATNPNSPSPPPADAVVVNILGINGAESFSPNPSTVPVGQTVVWHNLDTTTHRVVLDDGELDTGNIAPGAFSAPMSLIEAAPYHCSIHPAMVGTIVDGR